MNSHYCFSSFNDCNVNEAEAYRCYKGALQILVFNIFDSNIFSLRQFKDILLPINDFHGSIWLPLSNVSCNDVLECEFFCLLTNY